MLKAKITISVEIEYDLDPQDYPGVTDPNQMLEVDRLGAEEDPFLWFDRPGKWTIKTQLVQS